MAMDAPATIKDVQKLTGCMAALNRFLSRHGEWSLPFFKLLKQQDKFQWTPEVAEALENLKQHLQSPPTLTGPLHKEELDGVNSLYATGNYNHSLYAIGPTCHRHKKILHMPFSGIQVMSYIFQWHSGN